METPTRVSDATLQQPAVATAVRSPGPSFPPPPPSGPPPPPALRPAKAPRSPRRHRRLVLLVAAVVALALGVGTFLTVLWLRERPVHQALETAQASFASVIGDVNDARTIVDLNDVASSAQAARADLTAGRQTLAERDDDLATAALGVLTAQDSHLAALAALSDLDADSLTTWGDLSEALASSASQLDGAVVVLTKVDADAGERVEVDHAAQAHITSVVGEFSSETLAQLTDDLLASLLDARLTADLRATADLAASAHAVVEAAQTGLEDGSEQLASVTAIGAALDALAEMSTIDADHLGTWTSVRGRLSAAVAAVPELADVGQAAVDGTNRLVSGATRTMRTWRSERSEAVRRRAADLGALDDYSEGVRADLTSYGQLRRQLSDFVSAVEDDGTPYGDAVEYLDDALAARSRVRDSIAAASAPTGLGIDVVEMVDLTDRAIAVIDDVRQDFAANSPCLYCYSYDIDSWDTLHEESEAITTRLGPVQQAWESSVASARTSIRGRALPTKPVV